MTVTVTNTTFGPAQVATALVAVPLYANPTTDPVFGQKFVFSCKRDL